MGVLSVGLLVPISGAQAAASLIPGVAQAAAGKSEPLTPSALADLLEDPKARQVLVDKLREQTDAGAAKPEENKPSLAARMAAATQTFLAGMTTEFEQAGDALRALVKGQGWSTPPDWRRFLDLIIVAAVTVAVFLVLRWLATGVFARLDAWVERHPAPLPNADASQPVNPFQARLQMQGLMRRAGAMVAGVLIDIGLVIVAAMAGYGAGLYGTGSAGDIDTLQLLFVNAFVAVEVVKALIRGVFATRFPYLRLFTMGDDVARGWNGWLSRVASVSGYGLMVAEPLVSMFTAPALGRVMVLVLMLGVYCYAVGSIWRNRHAVRARLEASGGNGFIVSRVRMLARIWHFLLIAYFTVLLVVSQIDPDRAWPFMTRATLITLTVLAVGSLLNLFLVLGLSRRVRLSDELRKRLPLLEARLNAYVPAAIRGLLILVRIVMVLLILNAWHAFDLPRWLSSSSGSTVVKIVLNVVLVLLVAAVAWTVIASVIEHRLSFSSQRGAAAAREKTLLSLFRNATMIIIASLTVLTVLSQIGVDIAPLIAGAGVVGLAIGFGAQKLVQDIITGIFIQLENGMNQNDVVQVAGVLGSVEKLTIRSVGLRSLDGTYHLIPFSSVDVVSNFMRDFAYHLGEYTIAHGEDVDKAMAHMREAFAELMQDDTLAASVLEQMTIPGVTAINERGTTIRVLIKTAPGMQWDIQRAYNRILKKHFEAAGIEVPYPHTVVQFGKDKRGFPAADDVPGGVRPAGGPSSANTMAG